MNEDSIVSRSSDMTETAVPPLPTECQGVTPTSTSTADVLNRVKLLTYNLFLRPPLSSGREEYKNERLSHFFDAELHPKILSYDIICLQEVFSFLNPRKEVCIQKGKKLGFIHHATIYSNLLRLKPVDSGLVTLSKHPIISTDYLVFSRGMCSDGFATKGVLMTRILLPENTHLLLFNTHLQADYDGNNPQYWSVQQSQLQELRDYVKKKMTEFPDDEVIIAGDFNIDAKHHRGSLVELGNDVHSREYSAMLTILNDNDRFEFRDVVFECNQFHPVTYGNTEIDPESGEERPLENVLTDHANRMTRHAVDYIFFGSLKSDQSTTQKVSIEQDSSGVEPFFVENQPFSQLSDHYGVQTVLLIHQNSSRVEPVLSED